LSSYLFHLQIFNRFSVAERLDHPFDFDLRGDDDTRYEDVFER
jgi:hypothetical protein